MSTRIMLALVFIAAVAMAQTGTVTGTVADESGAALVGANVLVQDTNFGATTNANGEFKLTAPVGVQTLSVSFMGYETRTQTVTVRRNQTATVNISLTPQTVPLGEVSVTSMRYTQTVKDAPIPIAVVEQAKFQQTMPRTLTDVLQTEPGVSMGRDGMWGTQMVIRGLSRSNLVTLVDGNRVDTAPDLAAHFSMVDVNDIERVEVIKGAASSLYGTGAMGGVVNIVTRDGWYGDGFYATGSMVGGYSTVNNLSNGYLRANVGSKNWYVKLSGMMRDAGNVETPNGTLENSQFSDNNVSLRAGFRPFANHEIKLNVQRYGAQDIGIPGANPIFPSQADVRYPEESRDLYSLEYIARNLTDSWSRLSLKVFRQDILRDVENIPNISNRMPTTPPKVANVLSVLPRATHETTGANLQTDWVLGGSHHLIAGVDAWQKDLDSRRQKNIRVDVLSPETGEVVNSVYQTIGERPLPLAFYRSVGVYAQDDFSLINNRLDVTLGGRYDHILVESEKTMQPDYTIVNGVRDDSPANEFVLWDAETAANQSWSANLGLMYHLTANTDLTFNAARSFRSPFIAERYQYIDLGSVVKIGDPDLKPENGVFTDLGFRIWQDRYSLSANVFYNVINDMVVEEAGTYEGRNAFIKTNVGKAELVGFDGRLDVRLAPKWGAFLGGGYVRGQDVYMDEPLPLVPPFNGRIGLRGPVWNLGSLEVAASMFAEQTRTADWEVDTPGYVYFDAYFSTNTFRLGTLPTRLYFGLENITDRAYRNHLSTNRGAVTVEPGRNAFVRLQFGH